MSDFALNSVLANVPHLYLALPLDSGPHVTPELFTTDGDRLICMLAATTLKARILSDRPPVAFAARAEGRAVVGRGMATVLDPLSPRSVASAPVKAATGPLDAARFMADNVRELSGAVVDYFTGQLGGPIPPRRVLLSVEPSAWTMLEDGEPVASEGWDEDAASPAFKSTAVEPGQELHLPSLPEGLAELVDGAEAVIGWKTASGTALALPATWDAGAIEATVSTALFDSLDLARNSEACATFDTWTGLGPSGKQGLMLRGRGTAEAGGDHTTLSFAFARCTYWDGITTETVDLT